MGNIIMRHKTSGPVIPENGAVLVFAPSQSTVNKSMSGAPCPKNVASRPGAPVRRLYRDEGRGCLLTCGDVEENPGPKGGPRGTRMVEDTQKNDPGQSRRAEAATQETTTAVPSPAGEEAPNQPDHSNHPDPTCQGDTVSNALLPENALPRLDPIWASMLNPDPEVPDMQQDTPMHDPTDALSLVMQLCAAGMDLGDVTRLGAELGAAEPTNTEPVGEPQFRDPTPTRGMGFGPQPHHPVPSKNPLAPGHQRKGMPPQRPPSPQTGRRPT